MNEKIGEVHQKSYEKEQIEWNIHDFLSIAESTDFDEPRFSPSFSAWNNSSMYFRLHPKSSLYPEFMILYLERPETQEYSVKYKFGFKRSDGTVLNFLPGILPEDACYSEETQTMKLSELVSRMAEFFPWDVLTITCTLRREITQPIAINGTKSLKLIRLNRLSENFLDLFRDTETCDTTLKVKNKDYKAHRLVLIARSPVFAATFKHDTSERKTGVITIPDCDPDSFKGFLEYLYCGRLEEISFQDALSLYVTSDKYDVQELKEFCVEYLTQSLTLENVCEIVVFADKYDETQLLFAAQEFFMKNGFEILLTSEWENLMKMDYRLANKLLTKFSKANLKQRDPK